MNGGMTYKDLDLLKAKAKAFDEALRYLAGRCDNEQSLHVQEILRRALGARNGQRA